MLFLANNVSRMNNTSEMGTRIVEVHNGSSLFTGNAGGGESNLRRYIIENDLLEAIVAMPEKDFSDEQAASDQFSDKYGGIVSRDPDISNLPLKLFL